VSALASRIVCSGCGSETEPHEVYPFRCPNAGTGAGAGKVDHVLVRVLDPSRVRFPGPDELDRALHNPQEPFVRYRGLLHAAHLAAAEGMPDAEFCDLVTSLDRAVSEVAGRGFVVTPLRRSAALSARLGFTPPGGVWVKDETGNVTGSHKGRHLLGLLLHLEVMERLGFAAPADRRDLAIASCGNAALAAAVVARAGGRMLRVFVPSDADAGVVRRLRGLQAEVVVCARQPGIPGDPAYLRLRAELDHGAVPFTCQGNENGLVIEGGETLGYEIVSALARDGDSLDHIVVQVGGGALASACAQALREATELGALSRLPRIHTVQTASAHPLERAYARVRAALPAAPRPADIDTALRRAAANRAAYMWPWEQTPHSIATGILDDETYDWRAVVGAMLLTGGQALVVTEDRLGEANKLGQAAGYPVDPTGSAGLAGLLDLRDSGIVGDRDKVTVLFTGVQRPADP
jgi:threonine synthase